MKLERAFVATVAVTLVGWAVAKHEPGSYLHTDGRAYAETNRAIAEHFDLDIGRYERSAEPARRHDHGTSNVALGRDGTWRPKHSFLLPVFSTPLFVAFGLPGLLAFDVLAGIAMLWLAYRFAARFTGPGPAALATLALVASPIVLEQLYGYSHDTLCALLVGATLVALAERRMAAAGLFAGLALWAKATLVAVLLPMAIALLALGAQSAEGATASRTWLGLPLRAWVRGAIAFAIPCALHAAANAYLYGAPWTTSYARVLVTTHEGRDQLAPIADQFGQPIGATLERLLLGPRGVVSQLPLALVGFAGALVLLRGKHRAIGLGVLTSAVGFVCLFATYRWPHARYLVPWLPVLAVGLGAAIQAIGRTQAAEPAVRVYDERAENVGLLYGAAATGVIALATVALALGRGPAPRLSARLWNAVAIVDGDTCDYVDLISEQIACTRRELDRFRPLGRPFGILCDDRDGRGPLMLARTEHRGSSTTLTWRDVPTGRAPMIVLATERRMPGSRPTVVEVRANDRVARTFQIEGTNVTRRERLPAELLSRPPTSLSLVIRNAQEGVCLDVRWEE